MLYAWYIDVALSLTESSKICTVCDVTTIFQCLQYRTEHNQDVKKLEKLTNQLMRHMASKEK